MNLGRFLASLRRLPPSATEPMTIGLILLLWAADYSSGTEISFSIFYLLPVALASLTSTWFFVVAVSLACGVGWGIADTLGGAHYSHPLIPLWNSIMRILMFLLVGRLLKQLLRTIEIARQAEADAKAATRAKADFLANMSHEIRTPLNAMIGVADLLPETPLNHEQSQYTELFRAECDHLLYVVNDILDVSKIEAGQLALDLKPFDLRRLAEELIGFFTPRAVQAGIQIHLDLPASVSGFWKGDPHRLRQILSNLLSNAVKFTDKGEVRLAIQASPSASGEPQLTFTVSDTGPGISPEDQTALFRRFTQASATTASRYGGTGLGLSIVKSLVEAMNGTVRVQSDLGKGARFLVTLPLARSTALPDEPEPRPPSLDRWPTRTRPSAILLADDYPANQFVLKSYLKRPNLRVDTAENGLQSLELFTQGTSDLVIMDLQMPEMDGYAAARKIRDFERASGRTPTPILALSASAFHEDKRNALAAGCTAFLSKPVRRAELLNLILSLVPDASGPIQAGPLPALTSQDPDRLPGFEGGDDFLPQFIRDLETAIRAMRAGLAVGDLKPSAHWGHRFAGSAAMLGYQNLGELAKTLEEAAIHGNHTQAEKLLTELEAMGSRLHS